MKKLLFLALFLCSTTWVSASHLRCGYISAVRSGCGNRTVLITVTVFTNTASEVKFGEDGVLDFGDGKSMVIPRVENISRPDLGPNIGMAIYTINHTYGSVGSFLISYVEPNRNGGVLNMQDSFFTTFYTETKIDLTTCISSPVFLAPPIFRGLTNSDFAISLGATSPNDNLVTYEMGIPFRDRGLTVNGYVQPPNMSINKLTGSLRWLAEGIQQGEYNFAVIAFQWTKEGDLYKKIGFTRIDFQVILEDKGLENPPSLSDDQEFEQYSRVLVNPGEEKEIEISYETGNNSTALLEVFSELDEGSFSFSTNDVGGPTGDVKTGILTIIPQESDVRENGYLITVRGRTTGSGSNPSSVYDISYLIYTDEIAEIPTVGGPITATEKDIAQVEIFPNPVQSQVNIQVNKPGTSEVRIYTTQGTLIKARSFESNTILMLSELPSGVYICDVRRNNAAVRRMKLIKTE